MFRRLRHLRLTQQTASETFHIFSSEFVFRFSFFFCLIGRTLTDFFFSVLTDGRKSKKEFADFLRSGEQNEPQPVKRGRGRDEGRRGAKVRHKRMSDSAEHLQDNLRVSQTLEKNPGAVKSS